MEINNLKTIRGLAELQSNSTKNKTMGYGELISFYRNFAIGSDFIFFYTFDFTMWETPSRPGGFG